MKNVKLKLAYLFVPWLLGGPACYNQAIAVVITPLISLSSRAGQDIFRVVRTVMVWL